MLSIAISLSKSFGCRDKECGALILPLFASSDQAPARTEIQLFDTAEIAKFLESGVAWPEIPPAVRVDAARRSLMTPLEFCLENGWSRAGLRYNGH